MADGLQPVTGVKKSQFCSWSATLIDSLDTLYIMGFYDEFDAAVNATLTIDFTHNVNHCAVSLFESTIRYLGGMLGAYDSSGDQRLVRKLVEVGDMLYGAFDTPNGLPCANCHLGDKASDEQFEAASGVSMADLGSLYLEFGRLSQITSDGKYYEAVERLAHVFHDNQEYSTIPGLWPETVNARVGPNGTNFASTAFHFSVGAQSDSSYEYLLKAHMLFGGMTSIYSEMWQAAAHSIRAALLFRAMLPTSPQGQQANRAALFAGTAIRYSKHQEITIEPRVQHLSCFAGGLFALASRVFSEPDDLEIGAQLTEGCIWAYLNSPTGIMPESFFVVPCPDLEVQCSWNNTEWHRQQRQLVDETPCDSLFCEPPQVPEGFHFVYDKRYLLRPEAIESIFIMYRLTSDEYYRDVAWKIFQSIITHTRTPYGHSALSSVITLQEREVVIEGRTVMRKLAPQLDDMESFWFAETLKYFYLIFSDVKEMDLGDWVLNTEAHGLKPLPGWRGF
jgi:mannosyl-oligosaccharide alpha-1,2-mannosidase